jgi:hypothetical protein
MLRFARLLYTASCFGVAGNKLRGGYRFFQKSAREGNDVLILGVQRPDQFEAGISGRVLRPHHTAQQNIVCIHSITSSNFNLHAQSFSYWRSSFQRQPNHHVI